VQFSSFPALAELRGCSFPVFQSSYREHDRVYWVWFCGTDVGAGTCLGFDDDHRWERDIAEFLATTLFLLTLLLRYTINLPKYLRLKLF